MRVNDASCSEAILSKFSGEKDRLGAMLNEPDFFRFYFFVNAEGFKDLILEFLHVRGYQSLTLCSLLSGYECQINRP